VVKRLPYTILLSTTAVRSIEQSAVIYHQYPQELANSVFLKFGNTLYNTIKGGVGMGWIGLVKTHFATIWKSGFSKQP